MKCPNPNCSNDNIQPGDRFCGVCGRSVLAPASPAQGNATAPAPQATATVDVDFKTALCGGKVQTTIAVSDAAGRMQDRLVELQIPPGTPQGAVLKFVASGHGGQDLSVKVAFREHAFFSHNRGYHPGDLRLVFPVSTAQAQRGATVDVPLIDGVAGMKVPPHSSDMTTLRLAGMGLPKAGEDGTRGDLYVHLLLSDAAAQHYAKWGAAALKLLEECGVIPAEDWLETGCSPDEYRRKWNSPPNSDCSEIVDDIFGEQFKQLFENPKKEGRN